MKSTISYEDMARCANELRSASSDMQSLLEVVSNCYSQIGDGSDIWSGSAADSAKAEFDNLKSHFGSFYTAITDCAKFLDSVVATYQDVERKISSNN